MKILSYNIYGVPDTEAPILEWNRRQEKLKKNLPIILNDKDINIACFQEVNKYNMEMLEHVLKESNFIFLEKFPMKTAENINQYNVIAIRGDSGIIVNKVFCLPHGHDEQYKVISEQIIDYNMSDYRTTVFVDFEYNNKNYLVGNIHTDYISTEGKLKGMIKSLNYLDKSNADYKLVVGDMNMVCHMSEVYNILKENNNYITLSRNKDKFDVTDNSWHGYGSKEQVNVDFAFVSKNNQDSYGYKIIKQKHMEDEGSDHRPVIISIL